MSARVLVVDDSAGSMALLQAQLASEYLEVIAANDGAEALRKVVECQPDLVLIDAIMPGLSASTSAAASERTPRRPTCPS